MHMRHMRKKATKPVALCAAALCLAASLAGCAATADTAAATSAETTAATTTETASSDTAKDTAAQTGRDKPEGDYILTVDGYGVTEDEYLLFLRDQKAATANYYWVNYKMQPDNDFWHTEVDGQTPLDYAKALALTATITAKEKLLLAAEKDVTAYKNYPAMLEDMAAENADRAAKKANGEVFYGVTEFTPFTYYQYLTDNSSSELETVLEEEAEPTDAELKKLYEEYASVLSLGTTYTYTITTHDETRELTRNTNSIGKADTVTEDLIYSYFVNMQPGESFDYDYYSTPAVVTLVSVQDEGTQSFEEAKDSLKVFYARQMLQDLLDQRTQNAVVQIDQAQYDALEMP